MTFEDLFMLLHLLPSTHVSIRPQRALQVSA